MKTMHLPKKTGAALAAVAAVALLAGCETTGLSMRERSGVTYPDYIINLPMTGTNAPARPLVTPLRLAVAQVGEAAPADALMDRLAARKDLVASLNGLPLPGETPNNYGYYNRSSPPVENYASRIQAVCRLAQATGSDYVLIVGGNVDSWRKNNSFSVLDVTLIGGAVVPGTQIHVEGRAAGALVDAVTGCPVLFVNAAANHTAGSPDLLVNGKQTELTVQTRNELAAKLGDALVAKLAAPGR